MANGEQNFAQMANPLNWLYTADNLHEQALKLYKSRGETRIGYQISEEGENFEWDLVDKPLFLLGGFALENLIKGFLVYENPNWVANGGLSPQIRSHKLTKLHRKSEHIPEKNHNNDLLGTFERAIESWGRYPCGLSVDDSWQDVQRLEEFWGRYLTLSGCYSGRLIELLEEGWEGPHGSSGKVVNNGEPFYLGRE